MSKMCAVCGKKTGMMHQVSHSNRKTNRKVFPNLRKVNGKNICAKCLKAGKKPA